MNRVITFTIAGVCLSGALSGTAFAERLTLDCRAQKDPFDPYGTGRARIVLDFGSRKALFSGDASGQDDITEITDTKIKIGSGRWIDRTNGEYFHGLGFMDCSVAANQGF